MHRSVRFCIPLHPQHRRRRAALPEGTQDRRAMKEKIITQTTI